MNDICEHCGEPVVKTYNGRPVIECGCRFCVICQDRIEEYDDTLPPWLAERCEKHKLIRCGHCEEWFDNMEIDKTRQVCWSCSDEVDDELEKIGLSRLRRVEIKPVSKARLMAAFDNLLAPIKGALDRQDGLLKGPEHEPH